MYIKDAIIYNRRTKCEVVIVYAASAVCVLICLLFWYSLQSFKIIDCKPFIFNVVCIMRQLDDKLDPKVGRRQALSFQDKKAM